MQAEGCALSTVCSGDRAFASLADGESAKVARQPLDSLTAGLVTGIGIALGQRLANEFLSRRGRNT